MEQERSEPPQEEETFAREDATPRPGGGEAGVEEAASDLEEELEEGSDE